MDRKSLSFLALGGVLGVLLTTALLIPSIRAARESKGATERTVLKLAHVLDTTHPVHGGMVWMNERLKELSGGTVELLVIPNSPLGSETESLSQVRSGALAMTKVSAASLETFVPDLAVFGLPYLFRDRDHLWKTLEGPIGRELLAAGDSVGVHGLVYYDSGSRSFYTVGRPVLTPEDIKGMKIRVMQSPMAMDLIRTLGGSPTPVAFGELYTALQQGMVDGAENNPPSVTTSRHFEVAKHYSLDEHTSIPDVLVMSKIVWDKLPPQVQAWVRQAATESVAHQRKLWEEQISRSMAELEKAGVKIYHPDKAPFVEASAPVYEAFKGKSVGRLAERIRQVQ